MNNNQYFYRTAIFTRKNNQVALANVDDIDQTTPLDDWMGLVVSLADGAHTIQQLIGYMTVQYPQSPKNLEETLHSVISRLEEGCIIKLSKEAVELPYYLASPIEDLDFEKAKKLIHEDGYTAH